MPTADRGYNDDWGRDGMPNADPAPNEELPQYVAVANVLLQWRILEAIRNSKRGKDEMQMRAVRAWGENKEAAIAGLEALPNNLGLLTDLTPMNSLRSKLEKRLPAADCLGMLIELWMSNPFAPYEVKVDDEVRLEAARNFAMDLGVPPSWAEEADKAVREAQKLLGRKRDLRWLVMVAAGVVVTFLALPLATVLAPAGLAGGAAVLSGLAALGGSTGLVGGLSVVIGVAAVGTATATVGTTLAAGTVREVEDRVIILRARGKCKLELRPGTKDILEKTLLDEMAKDLNKRLSQHKKVEGKSQSIKDIEKKLDAIEKALASLKGEI